MSQADLTEWVGSDQPNEDESSDRTLPGRPRPCGECGTTMERRAKTMHDHRPWECPSCGHRQ